MEADKISHSEYIVILSQNGTGKKNMIKILAGLL
jgi:translation initiation factor RLI1